MEVVIIIIIIIIMSSCSYVHVSMCVSWRAICQPCREMSQMSQIIHKTSFGRRTQAHGAVTRVDPKLGQLTMNLRNIFNTRETPGIGAFYQD
jgi:hypothetical protein